MPRPATHPLAAINLNRIVVFVAVVETGSFTAAATRLGMAKTMVSTHVQRLEAELGSHLLLRTTRRLALTDAGDAFYAAGRRLVSEAEAAVQAASDDATALRGNLRITSPVDYAADILTPLLVRLRQTNPALHVELLSGDRVFDLVAEGIDVAIRVGELADSTLRAVRVGRFTHWLVGAPALLQGRRIRQPDDVAALPYVAMNVLRRPSTWTFTREGHASRTITFKQAMSANTGVVLRAAALAGAGISVIPDFAVTTDVAAGRLVRLLPRWQLPGGGIHAVYPSSRFLSRRARVFIDMLREHLARPL